MQSYNKGTATAFLSGVKTRIGALGVDGSAIDCETSKTAKLESVLKWARYAGKSTGIVTTTRLFFIFTTKIRRER